MIFVCSSCSLVEQKTRYEPWITRNVENGVNLFHLSYSITRTTYLCSQWAPNVQFKYSMFDWSMYILFVLNSGLKRDSLQMMIFECLFDMQRFWTKNKFWDLKWNISCIYVPHFWNNNNFGAGHWAYMCSPWALSIELMCFMCDWSIYTPLVLNTCWKRNSLQMVIFVYVCSHAA
jgi:hypothetical protein